MVIFTLLGLAFMAAHHDCKIVSPLMCRTVASQIYFELPFDKLNLKDTENISELTFQGVNTKTKTTKDFSRCIGTTSNHLRCRTWDSSVRAETNKYHLQLVNHNRSILWKYDKTFQPSSDFYYCLSQHGIEGLELIELKETYLVVKWKQSEWDLKYKFFQYHNLSVKSVSTGKEIHAVNFIKSCDEDFLCERRVSNLSECKSYNICVQTSLTKENKTDCIVAETFCNEAPLSENSSLIITVIIVAVVLIIAVTSVLSIVYMLKKRKEFRKNVKKRKKEMKGEEEKTILPRSVYSSMYNNNDLVTPNEKSMNIADEPIYETIDDIYFEKQNINPISV